MGIYVIILSCFLIPIGLFCSEIITENEGILDQHHFPEASVSQALLETNASLGSEKAQTTAKPFMFSLRPQSV